LKILQFYSESLLEAKRSQSPLQALLNIRKQSILRDNLESFENCLM